MATLFLAGLLVGAGGGAAFAATANGSSTSNSGGAYTYYGYASISNTTNSGSTYMSTNDGRVTPAGYMGVNVATYKGSSICGSASPIYTNSERASISIGAGVGNCRPGSIRTNGNLYAYQPDGSYRAVLTPWSPYLTF